MLQHVILIKFNSNTEAEQITKLKEMLALLPSQIKEIKSFVFGTDIIKTPRSYDFALVSTFDDTPALVRYQQHEKHIPVSEFVRIISESVVVVDFEF
ncbi:MAG: Dabb family protein [Deltaproteobacteria bacterium]